MECFKNGESQGVMFSDVYEGEYFPTASLYYGATVTMNFGPDFKYQPSAPARPYCDAVHRRNAELTLADIVGKVRRAGANGVLRQRLKRDSLFCGVAPATDHRHN